MAKHPRIGPCHICGIVGPRSFEHVPPAAAFNDRPIVRLGGRGIIGRHPDELRSMKGPISQRGAGGYTLCNRCNSDTGHRYGPAFVDWAYQGARLLQHAKAAPSLYHTFHLFPLRVIKQIFCMFFSSNPPGFAKANQELVRFVLNRDFRYPDPRLRVFVFFNGGDLSRSSSVTGRANFETGAAFAFSEIAYPPFGYVLSVDGTRPHESLVEISHFAHHQYNDWTDVSLRLPVHELFTVYPGDYRRREEVIAGVKTTGN